MLMIHSYIVPSTHWINNDSVRAKVNMENCITIIKDFLLENRMKLNDDKTEFLVMGTSTKLKKVNFDDIKIGKITIKETNKERNLGVIWDNEGKPNYQVSNICKIGFLPYKKFSCN